MKKPLIGVLAALLLAGATAPAAAAAAPSGAQVRAASADQVDPAGPAAQAQPAVAVSFAGTVALSNCSGSLVRMPNSAAA